MRATCAAQHGAKRQHVVVVGGVFVASLDTFIHCGLNASLQHSNLDREIGQAL